MIKIKRSFLLLTVFFLGFAKFAGGNLPYAIFYSLFFILFLGVLYIYIISKSVNTEIKYSKSQFSVGESETLILKINNDSVLPIPYMEVVNDSFKKIIRKYQGDAFFLNLNSSKFLKKELIFKTRGIYDFGVTTLKINDVFGVFQYIKRYDNRIGLKVYPKIYDIKRLFLGGSEKLENRLSNESKIEDLTLIKDIREYRVGDSLKRVHWKLSAKHGDLFVKNYDYVSGTQCNLFLDMRKNGYYFDNDGSKEELVIDFTVSLLNLMIKNGIKSKLFTCGNQYKKIDVESKEQFNGVMEYFLTNKSEGDGILIDFIHANLNYVNRRCYLGIITCDITNENRDELLDLKSKGYNVNLFYYNHTLSIMEDIKILLESGIKCYSILELINNSQ